MVPQEEQRRSPRCAIALSCALRRAQGAAFAAQTVNLGPGGALLKSPRPLTVDEFLDLDIESADLHIEAHARVLRHEGHDTYALRFEGLPEATAARLERLAQGGFTAAG